MDAAMYTLYERESTQWLMPKERQKRSKMAMMPVAEVTHSPRYRCTGCKLSPTLPRCDSMGRYRRILKVR